MLDQVWGWLDTFQPGKGRSTQLSCRTTPLCRPCVAQDLGALAEEPPRPRWQQLLRQQLQQVCVCVCTRYLLLCTPPQCVA